MRYLLALSLLFSSYVTANLPPLTTDQQHLVNKATHSLSALISNPNYTKNIQHLLSSAYGVILIPDYIKAGFLIGGEGGSGVILTKRQNKSWSSPSFIHAIGGSFGLQAGVENSEILLIVMTQKGLESLVNDSFTLGTDLSIAAGTLGGGLSAQTTANFSADIFAFSHSKGLFGGAALKGTVINARQNWNHAYYQKTVSPQEILRGGVENKGADPLRHLLGQIKDIVIPVAVEKAPLLNSSQNFSAPQQVTPPAYPQQPLQSAPKSSPETSGPQELLPWARG